MGGRHIRLGCSGRVLFYSSWRPVTSGIPQRFLLGCLVCVYLKDLDVNEDVLVSKFANYANEGVADSEEAVKVYCRM